MADFFCETAKEKDVFIVRGNGYLGEDGGLEVRRIVEEAYEKGSQKFILNFAKTPVINSPGVAQLIELSEIIVDERNCKIAYVGLTDLNKGLFKLVGLMKLGADFPDEAAALKTL